MAIVNSTFRAKRSNFINSKSTFGSGGCIHVESSLLECINCTITGNRVLNRGAFFILSSNVLLSNSQLTDNRAIVIPGIPMLGFPGIWASYSNFQVQDTIISRHNGDYATVTLNGGSFKGINTSFESNVVAKGHTIVGVHASATFQLKTSVFLNNYGSTGIVVNSNC